MVANAGALQVDADFIPVIGSNVAVDAASLELYDAEVCGKKDVYGRQRVANGAMDIGAVEAPWLNRYAQDLSRSGIVVTDASPMVVETESANVSILDGRLDLEWSNPFGREFKHVIPVKITGTGMLTVMLDGDVLGTVSKTDGDVELSFRSSLAVNRMSFVYVPGENDNGKAVIGGLKRIIGLVVVVR